MADSCVLQELTLIDRTGEGTQNLGAWITISQTDVLANIAPLYNNVVGIATGGLNYGYPPGAAALSAYRVYDLVSGGAVTGYSFNVPSATEITAYTSGIGHSPGSNW